MAPVEPGDLILVKTPGRLYALGRWLTGNEFDHVAVVADRAMTINVVKPRTLLVPAERMLSRERCPLVLRPGWDSETERESFVAWMTGMQRRAYDSWRTVKLLVLILLRRTCRLTLSLRPPRGDPPRWICTDAVLIGLETCASRMRELERLDLDFVTLGCGTTNDFVRIARSRPDLLRPVAS